MKRFLAVLMMAAATSGLFAAEAEPANIEVGKDAWRAYGEVKFNDDGSIVFSVPEDQKAPVSYIMLKKPVEVKPGHKFIVTFKAKGENGKFRVAGLGYHTSTGSKKGFRHNDKFFTVDPNEFQDISCELEINDKPVRGAIVEFTSPSIMASGKGAKLEIKDLKIVLEK